MLLLFDIDATLLVTQGSGMQAMGDAGRELFGPEFRETGVKFAGRLDPLILVDLLRENGQAITPENLAAMRTRYRAQLGKYVSQPGRVRALPGVTDVLRGVTGVPGVTLGLLTGNFAETGRMKLTAAGLDPDLFEISVWGDQSPHDPPARVHLPAVGMQRYRERLSREIPAERVTIIGDTPFDVECALAHGCRCLGVGTGMFSVAQLRDAGAHHAVPDLSDARAIVPWLLGPGPRTFN